MGCFVAPAAEAVITTIATKVVESKEKKCEDNGLETVERISFSGKMKWLNRMLWGGSALLAFEHVWHGEVVPYFPFLTSMANPEDAAVMFKEMSTVGVSMAALVTVVWIGMVCVTGLLEKKAEKAEKPEKAAVVVANVREDDV